MALGRSTHRAAGPGHATIGDKVAILPHGSVKIIGAMWIVRVALRRPYTFVVLALLILMVGPFTIARTPTVPVLQLALSGKKLS